MQNLMLATFEEAAARTGVESSAAALRARMADSGAVPDGGMVDLTAFVGEPAALTLNGIEVLEVGVWA